MKEQMTPRERVRTALSHRQPDRVPIDCGGKSTTIESLAYRDLLRFLSLDERDMYAFLRDHIIPEEDILDRFGVDTRYIYDTEPWIWKHTEGEIEYDEWGIGWEKRPGSLYFEPVSFPMADVTSMDDLAEYTWPKPAPLLLQERWESEAKRLHHETEYAVIGESIGMGIFESMWFLLGLEKMMIDFYERPTFLEELMDKILEIKIEQYDAYLSRVGRYIDVINVTDDLGTQQGPMISPAMYRRMIKPRQREWYAAIKKKTDAKLFIHSCGNIIEFIPDLIEIGIDIINPVQVSAAEMEDTARLKSEFGRDIVFWGGGCDTQEVLPFGTVKDVEREVKRRIADLSAGGGFIFAPVHNIQPGVPPENIVTLYETAKNYGT
jgi:uroporphyrinogen decarboxylase